MTYHIVAHKHNRVTACWIIRHVNVQTCNITVVANVVATHECCCSVVADLQPLAHCHWQ